MDMTQFSVQYLTKIPLLDAMQANLRDYTGNSLRFDAPLLPNLNDKGTGFAGSIASLCLISGWSLTTLLGLDCGIDTQTVIKSNQQRFLKPVQSDFFTDAHVSETAKQDFIDQLERSGRGVLTVSVTLSDQNGVCARFKGEYVAKAVIPPHFGN